jgi:signal peptide peptidase-like 2B
LYQYNNEGDTIAAVMGGDGTVDDIKIMAMSISRRDGQALIDAQPLSANLDAYWRPIFDPSMVVLVIIATSVVVSGAYWAAEKERAIANGTRRRRTSSDVDNEQDEDEEPIEYLDTRAAYGFIVVASIGLLVLFFFINQLLYVLIALFALGGAQGLHAIVYAVTKTTVPTEWMRIVNIPYLGTIALWNLLVLAGSIAIGLFWALERNAENAWILQDILAICLLLVIQRTLRLPNIKVATILLSMAFVYDIFWVFISPYVFGQSVMIRVATGGDTGEALPMLIKIPRFNDRFGGFSLLGLGDMALPGLFVSFLLRYDYSKNHRGWSSYFTIASVGYFFGMCFTDVSLVLMQSGQPALLYLVPCTLGIVTFVAWRRGEWNELWNGIEAERDAQRRQNQSVGTGTDNDDDVDDQELVRLV